MQLREVFNRKRMVAIVGVAALSFGMVVPAMASDEDTTSVTVTPGDLTISDVAASNFDDGEGEAGEVALTGKDVQAAATLDFTVTDARDTGDGYIVTAKASQFATADAEPDFLGLNLLTVSDIVAVADETKSTPPVATDSNSPLDNDATDPIAVTILTAVSGTGLGKFDIENASLNLTIPADTLIGTYTSTVTIDTAPVV